MTSAWSKPMPVWRADSARHSSAVGSRPSRGASKTMKSFPRPCILVKSSCMAGRIPYDPPMRLGPWIIAALLLFGLWKLYSQREVDHAPGMVAGADPEQSEIDDAPGIERGDFVLRPRADFNATVRILA